MLNHERVKALRRALGFSVNEMAEYLGLHGDNAGHKIRELERGARDVTGPMLKLIYYIELASSMRADVASVQSYAHALPKWLKCSDITAHEKPAGAVLMHAHWPRFYGFVSIESIADQDAAILNEARADCVKLDFNGLHDLLIVWIDEPSDNKTALLNEAARIVKARHAEF
jgi:transcriptional regulator with XRE-family HTH domain